LFECQRAFNIDLHGTTVFGDVMVSLVDGFLFLSGQTNNYKIDICCIPLLSMQH